MAKKDMERDMEQQEAKEPVAAPVAHVEPAITFDAWFASSERACARMNQPHHKLGMKKWANVNNRRTKAEWDRLFSTY